MFLHTDTRQAPWYAVNGDDKKRARLNSIAHFLTKIPYTYKEAPPIKLPKLKNNENGEKYERAPFHEQTFVPEIY
jgi:hypothetical protein